MNTYVVAGDFVALNLDMRVNDYLPSISTSCHRCLGQIGFWVIESELTKDQVFEKLKSFIPNDERFLVAHLSSSSGLIGANIDSRR